MSANLKGYDNGALPRSPVTWAEFEDLKRVVGFSERDQQLLLQAGAHIAPRLDELLGHWFGQLGSWIQATFAGPDVERYSAAAGARFARGVLDSFTRAYDQDWLDYQHEVGLRHSRAKKNRTDAVDSVPVVPLRHLIASIEVLSDIPDPFLDSFSSAEAAGIRTAWSRSLLLQVALWTRSYATVEDW